MPTDSDQSKVTFKFDFFKNLLNLARTLVQSQSDRVRLETLKHGPTAFSACYLISEQVSRPLSWSRVETQGACWEIEREKKNPENVTKMI